MKNLQSVYQQNLLGIGKIWILRNFVMDLTWIAWITPQNDLETFLGDWLMKIEYGVGDNIPLRKKKFTNKNSQPWYSDRLRIQKRMVHRRESIWKKYGTEHQWKAFQTERSRYNRMLNATRTEYFRKDFEQHKGNTKHLYKLVAK